MGFVVPNFPLVHEAFKKKGISLDIDFENNDQLRSSAVSPLCVLNERVYLFSFFQEIKKFVLDELTGVGKMSKLKSFEQVKDIYIHPEGFSIEEGLVTPTLKNKVKVSLSFYYLYFLIINFLFCQLAICFEAVFPKTNTRNVQQVRVRVECFVRVTE